MKHNTVVTTPAEPLAIDTTQLLCTAEAAALAGVGSDTLRIYVRQGRLACYRSGPAKFSRYFFSRAEIEQLRRMKGASTARLVRVEAARG